MILFLEDWEKKHPYAIVDTSTKNESWLRLAKIYQHMGVKNHAFMLALHNPGLQGIDPFDPSLTQEQILSIIVECKDNPWYFFREILKLSASMLLRTVQVLRVSVCQEVWKRSAGRLFVAVLLLAIS